MGSDSTSEYGQNLRREGEGEEVSDDLGWHLPTAARKFHYFIHEIQGWQQSLCGAYEMLFHSLLKADLEPSIKESCKKCAERYKVRYGEKESDGTNTAATS